jgi:hypothetical protein
MENFDQLSVEELMEVKGGTNAANDTIIVNCTAANSGYITKGSETSTVTVER